jgi:type IV secretion system protein VirB1
LTRDTVIALAEQCAPSEPSVVLASIARVESAYDPLRIGVNGPKPYALKPHSQEEAVALASHLIASGKNIDLGLAQINSRNLERLALTVQSAFDACRNLAAAAVIMGRGYKAALTISPQGRPLLQTAYSLYNTGDPIRGLANGYVDKVETARQR